MKLELKPATNGFVMTMKHDWDTSKDETIVFSRFGDLVERVAFLWGMDSTERLAQTIQALALRIQQRELREIAEIEEALRDANVTIEETRHDAN
jgi:hypothetical protein